MQMHTEFNLCRTESTRITYAAVFIPSPDNPDQTVKYLLPEGIRGASGFEMYRTEDHHRIAGKGTLCCGNCYEQGKQVPIHHRAKTDERVGGGDKAGTHATWSAYPNTIEDHHEECKKRRSGSGHAEHTHGVRWNINIPETYYGDKPPETIDTSDPRVAKRASKVIHSDMQELLAPAGNLSREQVQDSVYVVGGRATPHKDMMIDGDNWGRMVKGKRKAAYDDNLFKIFHVTIKTSKNIRDFANAASDQNNITEIKCVDYEFSDDNGHKHIIRPTIVTSADDVRTVFEKSGDYFVLCASKHNPKKLNRKKTLHEMRLFVDSPSLVAELYKDPARKIADYNGFHNLQMPMDHVEMADSKKQAKLHHHHAEVNPAQIGLFDTASPTLRAH